MVCTILESPFVVWEISARLLHLDSWFLVEILFSGAGKFVVEEIAHVEQPACQLAAGYPVLLAGTVVL